MKALVTGGKGFVGTHLIAHLMECGYDVVSVDYRLSNERFDIPYYVCDLSDKKLSFVFEAEKPDVIFHLAAQSSVPLSMQNPIEDAETNVLGTVRLLENAVRYHVKKIIFTSSAAVYGVPEVLPMTETHALQPTSFYGLSKVIGENYISMYAKESTLSYTILRFANVYGPGQHSEGGIITRLLYSAMENKEIYIFGDGSQTRDFVYVKDIVKACEKAAIGPSGIFNISNNAALSINELINHVNIITGSPLAVHYTNKRNGDILHSRLENKAAKLQLTWKPDFDIQKGLQDTMRAIDNRVYKGV